MEHSTLSAETWSLKNAEIQRLEVLEKWLWRNKLNINWMDKIPNRVGRRRRRLVAKFKKAKNMGWTCIKEREFITKSHRRKNTRKPTRGRKRIGMMSGLIGKEDYASLKKKAQDRNQWRNWVMKNEGQEPAD